MAKEPAVVDETVNDGGGDVVVTEDGAPPAELDVGGYYEAGFLIGVSDYLVEEPSPVWVDG